MNMDQKATLIQISDLHMDGNLDRPLHMRVPVLDGLDGHDDLLAAHLSEHWRTEWRTSANVAMTGDATRMGSVGEFLVARKFLKGQIPVADPELQDMRRLGLRMPRSRLMLIPGNHDHWAGYRPGAIAFRYGDFAPTNFEQLFGKCNWGPCDISPSNEWRIELFGVDSNSGFKNAVRDLQRPDGFLGLIRERISGAGKKIKAWRKNQLLQAGRISEVAFEALALRLSKSKKLDTRRVPVMRLILCHHPFENAYRAPAPLEEESRSQLLNLAAANGVSGILTGHTHYLDVRKHEFGEKRIIEVQAPTAIAGRRLERSAVHYQRYRHWFHRLLLKSEFGTGKPPLLHGLVEHEFELEVGSGSPRIKWYILPHLWDGLRFQPMGIRAELL